MKNKELETLLENLIGEDMYIYKKYEDEEDIYVFTKLKKFKDIDYDDRYATVGGNSPIIVNKKSKEFRKIHTLEVPTKLRDKYYIPPTVESITNGILKRKYVNFNDVFNFLEINFIKKDDYIFTLGDVLYGYDYNRETFTFHFKDEEIRDVLMKFLKSISVSNYMDANNNLIIKRTLES